VEQAQFPALDWVIPVALGVFAVKSGSVSPRRR